MKDFKQLQVWEKAHRLVLAVYSATRAFPIDERFGLTKQLRRAALSVPANIAEGCGRTSLGDLLRFLEIAMGSASELEYLLLLANDLKLVGFEEQGKLVADLAEVKRMLAGLTASKRARRAQMSPRTSPRP